MKALSFCLYPSRRNEKLVFFFCQLKPISESLLSAADFANQREFIFFVVVEWLAARTASKLFHDYSAQRYGHIQYLTTLVEGGGDFYSIRGRNGFTRRNISPSTPRVTVRKNL